MSSDPQITDHTSEDLTATKHLEPRGGEALEFPPGVTVGRYVIVERVVWGGMGTVYHAYDPRLNRRVALNCCAKEQSPPKHRVSSVWSARHRRWRSC